MLSFGFTRTFGCTAGLGLGFNVPVVVSPPFSIASSQYNRLHYELATVRTNYCM